MALTAGTRIGPYQVTSPLGEGGMGVVFRAHDTKLQRDVALKLLPDHFANDSDRLARFQREAQVLATLNHPSIAQIYGLEESGQSRCIVMELIEGKTLHERLRFGPIPIEEALPIAQQIAGALEAAHEKGVVHRDLKPANIKLTPDGKAKVLDFGLAKVSQDQPDGGLSNSPTVIGASSPGVILGTAAYMSPEQAKGKDTDRTTDIWAFGCVLYEMLTGRAVFEGETMGEILGGIFKAEPDWTSLPVTTPSNIRSLLRRCLQKDRTRRLRDIGDARFQIEDALNEPSSPASAMMPVRKSRERSLWLALMLVTIAATTFLVWTLRPAQSQAPEMRLQILTPPTGNLAAFEISPDGQKVVFEAAVEGKSQLWLRRLESETAQPLPGTENAYAFKPFWSPDSRSIGFFADNKLKRVDIGGAAQILADASGCGSGTWNGEGTIIFSRNCQGSLYRISATGGPAVEVTRFEPPRQVGHRFPRFLPDGRHFLFWVLGVPEIRGVYVGSLDSKESRRLFDSESAAVFAPPDHVLFAREGALFAQRMDMKNMAPIGDPFSAAAQVAVNSTTAGDGALSASAAGSLAYRAGGAKKQFIWSDRSGKQTVIGEPDTNEPADVRLSPDGRYIALSRNVSGNSDVWLMETARNILRRFTLDPDFDGVPIWSPDSSQIVFSSRRRGHRELYQKPVAGAGAETLLLDPSTPPDALDWSPDGRFVLYQVYSSGTSHTSLWALPLDGARKPFSVALAGFDQSDGRFSPDGRWVALQSTETGQNQIYVQPFPAPGGKLQVSTNGGTSAQWRRDGRELFYIGPGNRLMAVPIKLPVNGQAVEVGTPAVLFTMRPGFQYEAAPDGERFLINTLTEDAAPITIILNWKPKP